MAFRSLRANLSRLSKTNDTSPETPQFYLNHTKKCMKHVDSMVGFGASPSVKFNHEQCKYLAEKLRGAVQSALSCLQYINTWDSNLSSDKDGRRFLEIFKLLFMSSKEAETFILGCSEAAWVQFAILNSTNVSEHIASLGFDMKFCTIVLSHYRKIFRDVSDADVDRIRKAEGVIVKERSHLDLLRLYKDVEALSIQSRRPGSEDWERAMFLLERLKTSRLHDPEADLPTSNLSSRPERRLIEIGQQLGKGASGIVHKAKWLGLDVARKVFHGSSAPEFEREVKIWEGLCHPNIVSLLWYAREKRNCYMVLELMDGDLTSFIEERMVEYGIGDSPFSIPESVHMMLQVAEGMLFLHDKGIVHRDLKSGNILVKHVKATEVGTVSYVQVKVADFGLSRTKEKSKTYSNQTVNQGTTRWMAPEMMRIVNNDGHVELQAEGELKYPFKVDVYSFAMVCFEMLTGDIPFPSLPAVEVKKKVLDGDRPQIPDHCPERLRSLIGACWRPDPEERPRFGDICDELMHMKCAYVMSYACVRAAPRCFSLEEIKKMTDNFSKTSCMPNDCYYEMSKGVIDDTGEVVGVARARDSLSAMYDELEVLPRLHHSNVVGYAGFCTEKGERVLVFQYMPNGSLNDWLFGDASRVEKLSWPVRRNICLGVADGIHYLHSVSQPRIIHRGIKTMNILLDQNLEPKLGGFSSVSIIAGDGLENEEVDCLVGTWGYIAPESVIHGKLSQKVDVYGFGVVLLETVCGRHCFDISLQAKDEAPLVHWAMQMLSEGRGRVLIDRSLDLQADEEMEAVRIIQIAIMCLDLVSDRQPDMRLVLAMLRGDLDPDVSCFQSILEDWKEPSVLGLCRSVFNMEQRMEKVQHDIADTSVSMLTRARKSRTPPEMAKGRYYNIAKEIGRGSGAKLYTLAEVTAMTRNFDSEIGRGGFGPVYYGKLPDGQEVAVKVADGSSRQGKREFFNEVDVLSRVRHKNLVALVGYCQENGQQILIYEYMKNGSVHDQLFGDKVSSLGKLLDWKMRLKIGLDAAQGLEYLHKGCSPGFIHHDVKSSNILLSAKFDAKVADFGLTKLDMDEADDTKVLTLVMGTAGYLDPEYYTSHYLSTKSDVYSFGVVLLELITGRLPINRSTSGSASENLCDWVRAGLEDGNLDAILDPAVKASVPAPNQDALWKVTEIALRCVEPKSIHRTSMTTVLQELHVAFNLEDPGI